MESGDKSHLEFADLLFEAEKIRYKLWRRANVTDDTNYSNAYRQLERIINWMKETGSSSDQTILTDDEIYKRITKIEKVRSVLEDTDVPPSQTTDSEEM